jgi:hypothetical protein
MVLLDAFGTPQTFRTTEISTGLAPNSWGKPTRAQGGKKILPFSNFSTLT